MPSTRRAASRPWIRRTALLSMAALAFVLAPVTAAADEDCRPTTSSVVISEGLLACWNGRVIGDDITVDLDGLTIEGRGVVVSGARITVRNGKLDGTDAPALTTGIDAFVSTGPVLEDLTINGYYAGVYAGSATTLRECTLENNQAGFYNWIGTEAQLADTWFSDNTYGLLFTSGGSATITGNLFEGNRAGIQAGPSDMGGMSTSDIGRNRFRWNGFGIVIEQFAGADNVVMEDNEISASESPRASLSSRSSMGKWATVVAAT